MKIIKNKKLNTQNKNAIQYISAKPSKIKHHGRKALVHRIVVTNLLSILVVVLTYLWLIFFISNVGSFWDLFRKKEIMVEQDTIAPTVPFLESIPEATQLDKIDLKGKAEDGVKVILYIDGSKSSEIISDANGDFSFTDIPVSIIKQTFYVTSIDEVGNESGKSTSFDIVMDNEPPELEIFTPKKGEVFKSTGHTYRVTGKTEPGITILVNNQLAISNLEGEFNASIRLDEGDNTVTILARDVGGNETEEKVFVRFNKID